MFFRFNVFNFLVSTFCYDYFCYWFCHVLVINLTSKYLQLILLVKRLWWSDLSIFVVASSSSDPISISWVVGKAAFLARHSWRIISWQSTESVFISLSPIIITFNKFINCQLARTRQPMKRFLNLLSISSSKWKHMDF